MKGIPHSVRNDVIRVSFRDPAGFAGLWNPRRNSLSAYRAGEEAMLKGIPHFVRNDMKRVSFRDPAVFAGLRNPRRNGY
jgi:hypothetical protein